MNSVKCYCSSCAPLSRKLLSLRFCSAHLRDDTKRLASIKPESSGGTYKYLSECIQKTNDSLQRAKAAKEPQDTSEILAENIAAEAIPITTNNEAEFIPEPAELLRAPSPLPDDGLESIYTSNIYPELHSPPNAATPIIQDTFDLAGVDSQSETDSISGFEGEESDGEPTPDSEQDIEDTVSDVGDEQEPDTFDLLFLAIPECVSRLRTKIRNGYTTPPRPSDDSFRIPDLDPSETLSLKLYVAWRRTNGTVRAYNEHREVLQDATEVEILSLHLVRKLILKISRLEPKRIDMCPKSCMAFTGEYQGKDKCQYINPKTKEVCGQLRWKKTASGKQVPHAQFTVLPVMASIRAMFANADTASLLRYQDARLQEILKLAATATNMKAEKRFSDFADASAHLQDVEITTRHSPSSRVSETDCPFGSSLARPPHTLDFYNELRIPPPPKHKAATTTAIHALTTDTGAQCPLPTHSARKKQGRTGSVSPVDVEGAVDEFNSTPANPAAHNTLQARDDDRPCNGNDLSVTTAQSTRESRRESGQTHRTHDRLDRIHRIWDASAEWGAVRKASESESTPCHGLWCAPVNPASCASVAFITAASPCHPASTRSACDGNGSSNSSLGDVTATYPNTTIGRTFLNNNTLVQLEGPQDVNNSRHQVLAWCQSQENGVFVLNQPSETYRDELREKEKRILALEEARSIQDFERDKLEAECHIYEGRITRLRRSSQPRWAPSQETIDCMCYDIDELRAKNASNAASGQTTKRGYKVAGRAVIEKYHHREFEEAKEYSDKGVQYDPTNFAISRSAQTGGPPKIHGPHRVIQHPDRSCPRTCASRGPYLTLIEFSTASIAKAEDDCTMMTGRCGDVPRGALEGLNMTVRTTQAQIPRDEDTNSSSTGPTLAASYTLHNNLGDASGPIDGHTLV
ncbi:hypothetical protein DFP72DRAFT_1064032 [Ephemerocybe angulata]|uniref:Uncharacterized protein n=1 Tax=Ephemerocybe angulata TaxID=980116 RepID=A0A8H6MAP7_9AGAR|nr:hypothetical protein DFP72DRAFT_1064032 [Tulosesus angulatus]